MINIINPKANISDVHVLNVVTLNLSALTFWVQIPLSRGVLDTTLLGYDKVCQWLATDWWFSPGTPVSSTNKTDHHDITEILLKVAINTTP